MQMIKCFGKSMVSIAVLAVFSGVNAAEPTRGGRSGMMGNTVVNASRMPTMPTTGLTTIGNPAVTTTSTPAEVVAAQQAAPKPSPNPKPDPEPNPEPKPDPKPAPECADGGVKNSDYTIGMCMDDLKRCINTGALQGGMSDLYNEDVRNAIFGGMRLCQDTVDKCIANVRVNCRNIYNEKNDVWLDFNSRVIQPDYYNFVLRKTGLTPYQAENTCLLLDRNTFGSAFTAVSDIDVVRAEYKQRVGAYNGANGKSLTKDNPLGVEVNTYGYDGQRGHYARWDAAKAECLLRVGAYNKNSQIKNSWLFGAVGNDDVAEVWQPAGSRFTCNKDLFGFSLLNDTKTAAVVGIAGGAVVGAGVGAGVGAAVYDSKKKEADKAATAAKSDPCKNKEYRDKLGTKIMESRNNGRLGTYLYTSVSVKPDGVEIDTSSSKPMFENDNYYNMSEDQCQAVHGLYANAKVYEDAIKNCQADKTNMLIAKQIAASKAGNIAYERVSIIDKNGNKILMSGSIECGPAGTLTAEQVDEFNSKCLFVPLQLGFVVSRSNGSNNPFCNHNGACKSVQQIETELNSLKALLKEIEPAVDKSVVEGAKKAKSVSKGAEIGKGAAIGAATGVGVGGLATAITAFVERSNISCKVGDGLNSVALGKSHTINTLREFYVQWNLKLPDAITPTSVVTDAESWNQACGQFNNKLYDCPDVQINYKKDGKMELIPSACKISGNLCIVNDTVAVSRGEDEKEIQKIIVIVKPESLPKPIEKPKHDYKPQDKSNGYDYDDWKYSGGGTWTGVSNK